MTEMAWRTSARLEVAKQDHGVGEIAGIDRREHLGADYPLVRADQQRRHALLAEEHQQLVQLDREEPLAGHRVEVAVQAVEHDDLRLALLDLAPDVPGQ